MGGSLGFNLGLFVLDSAEDFDIETDDREENETADIGGECGGTKSSLTGKVVVSL